MTQTQGIDQPVIQHKVCTGEAFGTAQRQQSGVTGTSPDQIDSSDGGSGIL